MNFADLDGQVGVADLAGRRGGTGALVVGGTEDLEEVDLYRVRRSRPGPRHRLVDPVCGMELQPEEVTARLDIGVGTRVFCSAGCLQRFVAAPDRYGS